MEIQRRALLVLIALGGGAVLGSYVLAFVYAPAAEADLWGGIPSSWRGSYTVNMPSVVWLPLLAFYGADPTPMLWLTIRVVLFLVGGGASLVAYMLIRRAAHGPAVAWVAVVMFFFFWLQTMVLDALIWPAYYPA